MAKFRVVGSFAVEIEVENPEDEHPDVLSDLAYDKLQETKLKEFNWDNIHEFERID